MSSLEASIFFHYLVHTHLMSLPLIVSWRLWITWVTPKAIFPHHWAENLLRCIQGRRETGDDKAVNVSRNVHSEGVNGILGALWVHTRPLDSEWWREGDEPFVYILHREHHVTEASTRAKHLPGNLAPHTGVILHFSLNPPKITPSLTQHWTVLKYKNNIKTWITRTFPGVCSNSTRATALGHLILTIISAVSHTFCPTKHARTLNSDNDPAGRDGTLRGATARLGRNCECPRYR